MELVTVQKDITQYNGQVTVQRDITQYNGQVTVQRDITQYNGASYSTEGYNTIQLG